MFYQNIGLLEFAFLTQKFCNQNANIFQIVLL